MFTQATYKTSIFVLFAFGVILFFIFCASAIRINEIMYDLNGSDTGREWIEVYNDGSESINFSSWKFYEAETNHNLALIQGQWIIEAGSFLVIADNSATFLQDNPSYTGMLLDSSFSLSNTGEALALRNGSYNLANVTYSSSYGANGDGNSLQFIDSAWQSCTPTPGSANACQSQQNQTQNQSSQTNQTQQNETQNTTQQNQTQSNQTIQANQTAQNQSIKTIELHYPDNIYAGKNITIEIYAYNLDSSAYDIKIFISDSKGEIISDIYNEQERKWKSSTYYVNNIFSGTSARKNFILSIDDINFIGYANISVRLRKSGQSSMYLESSSRINISKEKAIANANESIINLDSGRINNDEDADENEIEADNVIRLNTKATAIKNKQSENESENLSVLFMSKTERIKRFAIYGFAVFLVFLIIVLFARKRI